MENKLMLIPVAAEQLSQNALEQIREIIRAEIQAKHKEDFNEKLLSPKEACGLFQPKISLVTLSKWEKDGRIPCHRIGGRVYYRQSEIISSLTTLKKYKKSL